jgi:hypothetical protein
VGSNKSHELFGSVKTWGFKRGRVQKNTSPTKDMRFQEGKHKNGSIKGPKLRLFGKIASKIIYFSQNLPLIDYFSLNWDLGSCFQLEVGPLLTIGIMLI